MKGRSSIPEIERLLGQYFEAQALQGDMTVREWEAAIARAMSQPHQQPSADWRRVKSRPWFAFGGAAAALGAFVLALFIVFQPSADSPPAVFAGWTPEPGPIDPAALAVLEDRCPAEGPIPRIPRGESEEEYWISALTGEPHVLPPRIIVEQRGNVIAALFADESQLATCIFMDRGSGWRDFSGERREISGAISGPAPIRPFTPPLWVNSMGGFGTGQAAATVIDGRVSDEVSAVTVITRDGEEVTASLANGFFLAWWPGQLGGTIEEQLAHTVVAYGPDGEEIARWPEQ